MRETLNALLAELGPRLGLVAGEAAVIIFPLGAATAHADQAVPDAGPAVVVHQGGLIFEDDEPREGLDDVAELYRVRYEFRIEDIYRR